MNCGNVRRLLSAYCDAELPSERRAAVRRHVRHCESCSAALETFKKLSTLTAQWADAGPSASLWQALAPKLMAAPAAPAEPDREKVAALPDANQKRAGARRSFKPVIEGLEDRYPLSGLLYAAGGTMVFSVIEPAPAYLRTDGVWAAAADATAGLNGAAHSSQSEFLGDAGGPWGDIGAAALGAVA